MKATELLRIQHRDLEALLDKLRTAGQGDERNVRQELAAHLVGHTVIEEELFYPAVREYLPEETTEAVEEHGLANVELARLLASRLGDETNEAKLAVLSEVVIRHVRREETDILATADRELGDETLNQLGERMTLRFRQIIDTGYAKLLQKALEDELPRAAARAPAKKTARRRAATKKAATAKARAVPRRAPAKRAAAKRGAAAPRKSPKPAPKPARAARGANGTTRTRP